MLPGTRLTTPSHPFFPTRTDVGKGTPQTRAPTPTLLLHLSLLYLASFLPPPPPPPPPPPEESVPRPRSLTSFGHFSGANRFIQEKTTNHVPVGASLATPSTYRAPAPPGTPHIRTHKRSSLGTRVAGRLSARNTGLKHSPLRYSPSPFWFPADCRCILGSQSDAGAEWQLSRAAAGAGTARRARKNTAPCGPGRG